MWTRPVPTLLLVAILALMGSPGGARTEGPIRDEAKLFSERAKAEAVRKIESFRRDHGLDLDFESITALPTADRARLSTLRQREVEAHFIELAQERARQHQTDGVLVLICENPRYVVTAAWPTDRANRFGESWNRMRRQMAQDLGRGGSPPDVWLLESISRLDITLATVSPPTENRLGWALLGGVLGVLAGWLILGYLRMRQNEARQRALNPQTARMGLFAGILGGMFGTMAGYWISDRLYRGGPYRNHDAAADVASLGMGEAPPPSDTPDN